MFNTKSVAGVLTMNPYTKSKQSLFAAQAPAGSARRRRGSLARSPLLMQEDTLNFFWVRLRSSRRCWLEPQTQPPAAAEHLTKLWACSEFQKSRSSMQSRKHLNLCILQAVGVLYRRSKPSRQHHESTGRIEELNKTAHHK